MLALDRLLRATVAGVSRPARWLAITTVGALLVAATQLAGPLLPLDVAEGMSQPVANWAIRGGFFIVIGALTGTTVTAVRHSIETGLVARLQEELHTSPHRPPDVWFAQATRYGRHVALELATIELAIATISDQDPAVELHVNASPDTLSDPALATLAAQLGPRPMTVELTEHVVIDDYLRLQASMNQLRARGIRVAVDDVGAGLASWQQMSP